ncbi:MAG: heme-copper oxidase subunit III [Phycisphaerae bacterium]
MIGFFQLVSTPAFGRDWFGPRDNSDEHFRERGGWVFGVRVFLASLAMLFGATLALVLITWIRQGAALQMPRMPALLFVSTPILILSSITLQWAQRAVRSSKLAQVRDAILLTLVLGAAFLVMQFFAWVQLTRAGIDATPTAANPGLGSFCFYLLTTLHAAHVIGGIISLTWVTIRALRMHYTAAHHQGLRTFAAYWHFLDVVWLIMFALILAAQLPLAAG